MKIPSEVEFEDLIEDEKVETLKNMIDELLDEECKQLYEELMKIDEIRELASSSLEE